MKNLGNKRIIITGASSGIGKATAIMLSHYNVRMVLTSRNFEALNRVSDEIIKNNPGCPRPFVIPCDMTKPDEIRNMIHTSNYLLGKIDVLINNAGWGVYGESELFTMNDFRQVMEVNYFGTITCMYEALKFMKEEGSGHILNISSVAALHGVPYLSAYCASKSALTTLSQGLKAELNGTNIEISIIYPGYTQTDFFRNEKKVGKAVRPDRKFMPPEKVAKTILNTIIKGRKDHILSLEGKLLYLCRGLFPKLVEKVMRNIALKLSH
jgi:short-subunit dehydrogenase